MRYVADRDADYIVRKNEKRIFGYLVNQDEYDAILNIEQTHGTPGFRDVPARRAVDIKRNRSDALANLNV